MKTTKKVLSILLALVMLLSVAPVVLAEGSTGEEAVADYSERVTGWKANYDMILDYLFENEQHIAFNYLIANDQALRDRMTVSTVFALHDSAWRNGITGEVDVDIAEQILLALVERVNTDLNTDTVELIQDILQGVETAAEAVEKVNDLFNISEDIGGETWNDVFKYLGYAITAVDIYKNNKAAVIEAYARILSAKAADVYFGAFLQYIIDNTTYGVLKTAATNLKNAIDTEMEVLLQQLNTELVGGMAADGGELAANIAIDVALNSNPYTAVAKKVYDVGVNIVDFLWNFGDEYNLIQGLYVSVNAEVCANEWAQSVLDGEDAQMAAFAISTLVSMRDSSTTILENYKLAQTGGIIGRIKNKINKFVTAEYTVQSAKLDLIREAFFLSDVADYKEVTAMVDIFCPVDVAILNTAGETVFTIANANSCRITNEYGLFAEEYCDYSSDFLKIAFLYDNEYVKLIATGQGVVSAILDLPTAEGNVDFSFTEAAVYAGTTIIIPTDNAVNPSYIIAHEGNEGMDIPMNAEYVMPAEKEASSQEVSDAIQEIVKEEANSFIEKIKAFFQKIMDFFKNLFKR
ncbi:MAG TPA: hypothetical protein GXZ23_04455 [Clostridiales bacterium]|nr:hypothetical protein [Clostridiales bacterium]